MTDHPLLDRLTDALADADAVALGLAVEPGDLGELARSVMGKLAECRALCALPATEAPALPECEGHPAGPLDPMGETVFCDGSCVLEPEPAPLEPEPAPLEPEVPDAELGSDGAP